MISPASLAEPVLRHDLVFLAPERWRSLMVARHDLGSDPTLETWVDRGWPLIARRADAADLEGLYLGLPLPPSLGKRRIAVTMQLEDVLEARPPPLLDEARAVAPASWTETLALIAMLSASHAGPARVFGSLAWQWITQLPYLTVGSDLDLLMPCAAADQVAALSAIAATAPMRIDAELVRPDGAAVNWRELQAPSAVVLVKSMAGVATVTRELFLEGLSA